MLAFMGLEFRTRYYQTGQHLYRTGQDIQSFIIVSKGIAAFIQENNHNQIFSIVSGNQEYKDEGKVLTHCGFEDSVVNHCEVEY